MGDHEGRVASLAGAESKTGFLTDEMIMNYLIRIYDPGCRYLKNVEVNLPSARGVFKSDYTYVLAEKLDNGHFSAFENVIAFNQLGYVMCARALLDGFFPELPRLSIQELMSYQMNSMFVLSINNVHYKKPFLATQEFNGKLTIANYVYKPEKSLILADIDFDFGDGKCVGNITVALKMKARNQA